MKKAYILISIFLLMTMIFIALAAGGDSSDPVVTLGYLNKTTVPQVTKTADEKTTAGFSGVQAALTKRIEDKSKSASGGLNREAFLEDTASAALQNLQKQGRFYFNTNKLTAKTFKKDDVIYGAAGCGIVLKSGGTAVFDAPVINITAGAELNAGQSLNPRSYYMFTEVLDSGVKITSETAEIYIDGAYRLVSNQFKPEYTDLALALNEMGLFKGTNNGYELGKGATRAEALTMLIRLLGEESTAQSGAYAMPFNDVDTWAKPYVSYGFSKGYTNGIAPDKFGGSNMTVINHYATFILRALGYNDTAGDFKWDQALDYAVQAGIISRNEYNALTRNDFYRDQMVYLSYYALTAKLKGGDSTLLDKLISNRTIDRDSAERAMSKIKRVRP